MGGQEFDRLLGRAISKRDQEEAAADASHVEHLQWEAMHEERRQQLLPEVEALLARLKVFGPKFDYPDSAHVRFGRVDRGWQIDSTIPLRTNPNVTLPERTNCMVIGVDGNIYPGMADTYDENPDHTHIGTSNGMWHKPKEWQTFPFEPIPVGEVSDAVLERILKKVATVISRNHLESEWQKIGRPTG